MGLLFCLPRCVFSGQETVDPGEVPLQLEPVTVEVAAPDPAGLVTGVTVVDRGTLAGSNKSDLDKVLRGLPGVTLLRNIRGGLSAFSLRGANAGQGQLMLDGIPLYSTIASVYNLDAFAPEMLQRVEVVRGPAAIRYGSLAPGGTVRLFSRDERKTGAWFHLQGGSYGTLSETGTAALAGSTVRATVTGKHENIFDGVSQADRANGNLERDGYVGNLALLQYAAEPSERVDLNGTFYYGHTDADIDGFGVLPSGQRGWVDDFTAFGRNEIWVAQQSARMDVTPRWQSSLQLGYNRSYARVRANNITGDSDTWLWLLRWRNRHRLHQGSTAREGLALSWGAEAREEEGRANSLLGPFDDDRTQFAGLLGFEAFYGPWTGIGDVRVDHYDGAGTHGTYYLGVSYDVHPTFNLRAGGGHVYRLPTFHEWHFPFFGNPLLEPESSDSGELGLDWMPFDGTHLSMTGFFSRYRNLIRAAFSPTLGLLIATNIPRSEVAGVELEAVAAFDSLSAGFAYTFQGSRDLDSGRSVPRLPQHVGKIFGEWRLREAPLTFGAEIVYRSGYFDDFGETLRIGDLWLANLQAVYTAAPELQLYVRGENLLDDRTPADFSLGQPGRAVYGGIKLSFR